MSPGVDGREVVHQRPAEVEVRSVRLLGELAHAAAVHTACVFDRVSSDWVVRWREAAWRAQPARAAPRRCA